MTKVKQSKWKRLMLVLVFFGITITVLQSCFAPRSANGKVKKAVENFYKGQGQALDCFIITADYITNHNVKERIKRKAKKLFADHYLTTIKEVREQAITLDKDARQEPDKVKAFFLYDRLNAQLDKRIALHRAIGLAGTMLPKSVESLDDLKQQRKLIADLREDAQGQAAKIYYEQGLELIKADTSLDAGRRAYRLLTKCREISSDYKEVVSWQAKAKKQGTYILLLLPTTHGTEKLDIALSRNINNYLQQLQSKRPYKLFEIKYGDESQVHHGTLQYHVYDTKFVRQPDNPIKFDYKKKVDKKEISVKGFRHSKSVEVTAKGKLTIKDNVGQYNVDHAPTPLQYIWQNEWLTYRGKKEYLKIYDQSISDNEELKWPTDSELLYGTEIKFEFILMPILQSFRRAKS